MTQAQKDIVQSVIDYNAGNYEKPLDHWSCDRLSLLHTVFGYDSQIKFKEDLRDKPFSTLLTALLQVTA